MTLGEAIRLALYDFSQLPAPTEKEYGIGLGRRYMLAITVNPEFIRQVDYLLTEGLKHLELLEQFTIRIYNDIYLCFLSKKMIDLHSSFFNESLLEAIECSIPKANSYYISETEKAGLSSLRAEPKFTVPSLEFISTKLIQHSFSMFSQAKVLRPPIWFPLKCGDDVTPFAGKIIFYQSDWYCHRSYLVFPSDKIKLALICSSRLQLEREPKPFDTTAYSFDTFVMKGGGESFKLLNARHLKYSNFVVRFPTVEELQIIQEAFLSGETFINNNFVKEQDVLNQIQEQINEAMELTLPQRPVVGSSNI